MTVAESLYKRMTADTALAAIVGTRVYFGLSLDSWPSITLDVQEEPNESIDDVRQSRFDVTIACEATTSAGRTALVAAVRATVNRQEWTDTGITVQSSVIKSTNEFTTTTGNPGQIIYTGELSVSILATIT